VSTGTRAGLEEVAAAWIAAGRAAWPGIEVEAAAFVAAVTARLPEDADAETAQEVHAADLWLVVACAGGDAGAIAAFDAGYLQPLGGVLGRIGLDAEQVEDVKQELRRKLLVGDGDGDRPRIAEFSGRADLRTWMRTVAVRAGMDVMRRRRELPIDDEDELAALPAAIDDPELAYLKAHYRDELRDAIGAAIAALEPRDRLLLKCHYVDRLGVERLGAMFRVHHVTAARWLNAAREALATRTQRILVGRLGVSRSELRRIARLVESQLDVSMRRLLADAPGAPGASG
jgi:RNA polymerase sigma-70 factor (ECF subfamily)